MDYKSSKEIQKVVEAFFEKLSDGSRSYKHFDSFIEASDATLHCQHDSDSTKFEEGFDLGSRYTEERIEAKLNGKPVPDIWIAFAPETNHFFIGTEQSVIDHLTEAAKSLELESCVCSAMTLFNHGCQCSKVN